MLFYGEVLEPYSVDQVKSNLAERYKMDADAAEPLFDGRPHAITKQLKFHDADQIAAVFKALGALVHMQELSSLGTPADAATNSAPAEATSLEENQPIEPAPKASARKTLLPVIASGSERVSAKVNRRRLLRYRFDSFMAKGGSSIFKALVLSFLYLFALIGGARGLMQLFSPDNG